MYTRITSDCERDYIAKKLTQRRILGVGCVLGFHLAVKEFTSIDKEDELFIVCSASFLLPWKHLLHHNTLRLHIGHFMVQSLGH